MQVLHALRLDSKYWIEINPLCDGDLEMQPSKTPEEKIDKVQQPSRWLSYSEARRVRFRGCSAGSDPESG